MTAAAEFLRELAREVARAVVAELRAGELPSMLDQVGSPLGRRRHITAVRRLVAEGKPGAAVVGRRHLLTREALEAELGGAAPRTRTTRAAAPQPTPRDEVAAMRERYGFVPTAPAKRKAGAQVSARKSGAR